MLRTGVPLMIAFVAVFLFHPTAARSDETRESIESTNRAFAAAFLRGDADAVAGLYTIDAQLIPPGAEVVSRLLEKAFFYLEAPVARVTGFDITVPLFSREQAYLPNAKRILRAARKVLSAQ